MSTNDFDSTSPADGVAEHIEATDSSEQTPPKRFTKRSWVTLAVAGGALIVAAAIAVPVIVTNIARGEAMDALAESEASLTAAHTSLVEAQAELVESGAGAVVIYDESGQFVKVVRVELLADAATLESLNTARSELVELAGLTVEAEVATAPAAVEVEKLPAPKAPTTIEAMEEQTESNDKLAAKLIKDAEGVHATVDDITAKGEDIAELTEAVVASGAEFGAAVTGVEKATVETTGALAVAVTALADTETPAIGRFSAYVGAFDAVKASHDATVAAEQAAAEEAARQEQARRGGGSSNGGSRGGSSGGSSGGSNGGNWGGSNGGSSGGSSGGGAVDGNTTAPRGSISKTGAYCTGSGGGASANWGSNLIAPAAATSVWVTFEDRGVSWGIGWSCLSGEW